MKFSNLLRWLVYLPIGLLLLVAILVATEFGSRLLIQTVDGMVPGLEMDYKSGRLNNRLALAKFSLELDDLTISASDIEVAWNPWCTLTHSLCIHDANARDFSLILITETETDSESAESDDEPYTLALPFTIDVRSAAVAQGKVIVDDIVIQWTQGAASVYLQDDRIDVRRAHFKDGLVHVDADESAPAQTETAQAASSAWPFSQLDDTRIPLKLLVNNAVAEQFTFAYQDWLSESFSNIFIDANWQFIDVQIERIGFEHQPYGVVELHGDAQLAHPYPMQLDVTLEPQQAPLFANLKGSRWQATIDGDLENLVLAASEQQRLFWQINGDVALANPDMPFHLSLAGKQMIMPDELTEVLQYQTVSASAQGNRHQQEFEIQGQIDTEFEQLPIKVQITASGQHGDQQLTLANLQITDLLHQGSLSGDATLDYRQGLSWLLNGNFEQLRLPQWQLPDTPVISGDIKHSGRWHEHQWQLDFTPININGDYLDMPVSLQGKLSVNNKLQGYADDVSIEIAGSQLQLSGRVDEQWQVTGKLLGKQLNRWLEGAVGTINSDIEINGRYDDPHIAIKGQLERFGYDQSIQAESATIAASYRPLSNHQHQFELAMRDTELGHLESEQITLTSAGDLSHHQLKLSGAGDFIPHVELQGGWSEAEQSWTAQLQAADFVTTAGHWRLDQPVDLHFGLAQQQFDIGKHCWQARDSSVCLRQPATLGQTGHAELSIDISGHDLTRQLLHQDYQVSGHLKGELDAHWRPEQRPNAEFQLTSQDLTMAFHSQVDSDQQQVDIGQLDISGAIDDRQAKVKLELHTGHGANLSFHGSVQHDDTALAGQLSVSSFELGHFKSLLPDIERVKGFLNGQASIAGTLSDPLIEGEFNLNDGEIVLLSNPTPIDRLNLSLQFNQQQANLNSQFHLGKNAASLTAAANWRDQFTLTSRFTGDKLAVLLPPESSLVLTPDLRFDFAYGTPALTGTIAVPKAEIVFRSLPDTGIAVSDDQVFIDQIDPQSRADANLNAKINIALGDDIRVNALGFIGRIGGQLEVIKQPNVPVQLYGPIELTNGRYRAYGQRLDVQSGSAVHFNGPPELAALNIRAAREIKSADVIAGIHATGTVKQPIIAFYSDPAMQQQEVLSYIIRGRGLDSDDSNSTMAAATALGVTAASSLGITNSMEQITGIQQVSLDTEGEGDETQVTISGYVGERLFLKYGMGVFEPINEVTVRFYLLNQLWVETVSGIENSADLYYSFFIE
ncbi:translocation/assembly module TamB domain-containing protein [Neiella sp. HB171785]|uniref:Translocation/assembly module TamB domain-containing protein n=1 Tax=Neiella litorisoli TaxID=2771431 RepID=A0A8J6QII5_9GAMM|nr:translocation/assembly module TamB domain-containing protein [Neiella litorisoli]MBD1390680.1 translocation/assembly module TamB domain-containing protein [Neiella litorisoli]